MPCDQAEEPPVHLHLLAQQMPRKSTRRNVLNQKENQR